MSPSQLFARFERRFAEQVPALGLAVFRIAFGLVLMLEVAQLLYFRELVFVEVPALAGRPQWTAAVLVAWLAALVLLVLGLLTRVAAAASYLFTLVTLDRLGLYAYHHDYLVTGVGFLLLFLPVSRALSLDRWRAERARRRRGEPPLGPATASVLAYDVPVYLTLGLVYFDSGLRKLASPMWRAGLGLWQPASAPYNTFFDWSPLLDQELLVRGLGYAGLVFEVAFLFLIGFRRLRWPLLAGGLVLHLGILAVFGIPLFALGMVSLYVLLVPPEFWARWARHPASGGAAAAGASVPAAAVPFAAGRRIAVAVFLALATLGQAFCLLDHGLFARATAPIRKTPAFASTRQLLRQVAGITSHSVFMDSRHRPYRRILAVVYVDPDRGEIWLPLLRRSGHAAQYATGRQLGFWVHGVCADGASRERIRDAVRQLTAFWSARHGVSLDAARFRIRAKTLEPAKGWEPGLLRRQRARRWRAVGTASWTAGRFAFELKP
ncbi:MAG TPA: HTTM domain-containing protein [Thermoanaerobaculia bacterium]|nr:HTTM domain-containing protein [Thermoanaerobaculia bacterium]